MAAGFSPPHGLPIVWHPGGEAWVCRRHPEDGVSPDELERLSAGNPQVLPSSEMQQEIFNQYRCCAHLGDGIPVCFIGSSGDVDYEVRSTDLDVAMAAVFHESSPPADDIATASPAPAGRRVRKLPTCTVTEWLADTGCGHDLIQESDIVGLEGFVRSADVPLQFRTANGAVVGRKQIDLQIPGFAAKVSPYVLPVTPPVLSVGRRCAKEGYQFYWPAKTSSPVLVPPLGTSFA